MFEGDVILGTVEEVEQQSERLRVEMASAAGVADPGGQFRWPGIVPLTIDPDVAGAEAA